MPDDLTNRGPADGNRINIHEPHEVAYWTRELGVSAEDLKMLVEKCGVMAHNVRKHLGQKPAGGATQ